MTVRFSEHTADVRMEITANSYEELFAEALKGLAGFIAPRNCPSPEKISQKIEIQSNSYEDLLVEFLSEILFLLETKWILFCEISFESLSEKALRGTLYGTEIKEIREHVKAITYENLQIEGTSEGLYVGITLDI